MTRRIRFDDVVPFAMELVSLDIDLFHFVVANLAAGRIFPAILSTRHFQSLGGCSPGDEIDDRFVITQRLATPV